MDRESKICTRCVHYIDDDELEGMCEVGEDIHSEEFCTYYAKKRRWQYENRMEV